MKPSWDELQLSHVDLHFHAGTERPAAYSLDDVVSYARATGRRVLGLTDHWGRYVRPSTKELRHYTGDMPGFAEFAADVADGRANHPDMAIAFGPEIPLSDIIEGGCEGAFVPPEVDYFMGEQGGSGPSDTIGEEYIAGMEHMARLRDRVGRPCFIAHPLRSRVNYYVGKAGPGPKCPAHPACRPLERYADPLAHVEELMGVNLTDLARASVEYDVPLEINESSWGRILGQNQEWFAERYLFFFRALLDMGAQVVLGSDQHSVESGACTPFTIAKMLGVTPGDMKFLRHWVQA
jgi:hypothetical protein